jgi:hypothetical protein
MITTENSIYLLITINLTREEYSTLDVEEDPGALTFLRNTPQLK